MEETNALRQLPEIQNIAEYLRGMEFRKKLFGGVDVESVLEHFSAVTLQYEAVISAYMRQADDYARRLAEARVLLQDSELQHTAPAGQPPLQPQPEPWYGHAPAYPQARQLYADSWAQQPAPQAYDPWERAAAPQAAAYAWQVGAQGPQPPSFPYA